MCTAGSPIPLQSLLKSTFFRQDPTLLTTPDTDLNSNSTQSHRPLVPVIAPAEHAVTGQPGWDLHPCHTHQVVQEILSLVVGDDGDEDDEDSNFNQRQVAAKSVGPVVDHATAAAAAAAAAAAVRDADRAIKWMEAWFMLIGSVVALR